MQDADQEVEFAVKQYRRRNGRAPRILREDFCGTALVASQWVKGHPNRLSIGLDLDKTTLQWARQHNVGPLGPAAKRVQLRQQDVRTVTRPKADVVAAMNFSYYTFSSFSDLIRYFRVVRRSLAPGGIFILDTYGGWESQQVIAECRKIEGPQGTFGYVWDQAEYDPVNNRTVCHIHFEFKNGRRWNRAFTYDWRLYTPPEVRDALLAAGFDKVEVFWDVEEDEDASDYRPAKRAENSPGWIAYLVAEAVGANGKPRKAQGGTVARPAHNRQ